jgi:hypothetical protein
VGAARSAILTAPSFTLSLPQGVSAAALALSANGSLDIDDRAVIKTSSGGFAQSANAGVSGTTVGTDAQLGTIVSDAPVTVAQRTVINGNVTTAKTASFAQGAVVTGTVAQHATLTPPTTLSWTAPAPGPSAGNVTLSPGTQQALPPGNYANLTVFSRSTITLASGVYFFTSVDIEPQATVTFTGPTVLYVTTNLTYEGAINDTVGNAALLLAYSGTNAITINSSFTGTLVAPNAAVAISSNSHIGAFFGQSVEVRPGASIVHQSFPLPPSSCIGATSGTSCGASSGSAQALCEQGACVNATCGSTVGTSGDTQTFTVGDNFGGGLVTYTQTVTSPVGGPQTTTITTSLGGQALETETRVGPTAAGVLTSTVVFGPAVQGIHEVDLTTDGTTVNEVVDGRTLEPLLVASLNPLTRTPPPIVFADGNPPPVVTADDGVPQALAGIAALANASLGVCGAPTAMLVTGVEPLIDPPPPPFEPGHTTDVSGLSSCQNCTGDCSANLVTCLAAASAAGAVAGAGTTLAIGWTGIGILVGLGVDAGVTGTADAICGTMDNSCVDNCGNIGSGCCPQSCGTGCCAQSESCLDTGDGLCCSAGYKPCDGPAESCVDPTVAQCLPSGAGCPFGVATCGTGVDTVCCPSGICAGNTCASPPDFAITVALTETSFGPDLCINGTGFTPGAKVTITYSNVPENVVGGFGTAMPVEAPPQVDAQTDFSLFDTGQGNSQVTCTQAQAFSAVTISATDGEIPNGTGNTTTTTVSAAFWCANFLTGGGSGTGTCK